MAAALLLSAGNAAAHGPAPAALQPLSADADGPRAVLTSIGIATRWGDGFRYLGPSRWETPDEIPFAGALPDGRLVVASSAGVFLGDADGCALERVSPLNRPVFGTAAGGGVVHVLARSDGGGSTTLAVTGGDVEATLWADVALDSGRVDGEGTLWLAASRPEALLASFAGTRRHVNVADLDFLDLRLLWPEAGPPRLAFVVATSGPSTVLLQIDPLGIGTAFVLLRAESAIHGPVLHDGGLLVVADGALRRRATPDAGAFEPIAERAWTCLHAIGGVVVGCQERDFVTLDGEPWFTLDAIRGPDPDCGGDERNRTDWIHFGGEAALVQPDAGVTRDAGATDARSSTDDAGASGGGGSSEGCAVSAGPGAATPLFPLLFARLRRRRRIA